MFHSTTDIDLIFLINYLHLKLIRGFTDSKINVTSYIKTSPDTLYRYYTLLIMGKRRPDAPGEVPYEERISRVMKAYSRLYTIYEESGDRRANPPSIRRVAYTFNLTHPTLDRRLHGVTRTYGAAHEQHQRLSAVEENNLVVWVLQMERWGWPPRVSYLRAIASELLAEKGDTIPLGVNWVQKFLGRHPGLTTRFCEVRDRERAMMHDKELLTQWFDLYRKFVEENDVLPDDTYNMDEKGFALGQLGSLKVVCESKKYRKRPIMIQDGSRQWATVIEGISALGLLQVGVKRSSRRS